MMIINNILIGFTMLKDDKQEPPAGLLNKKQLSTDETPYPRHHRTNLKALIRNQGHGKMDSMRRNELR